MDAIGILIVDDEPPARRGIRRELSQFADAEVLGEASGGDEAVALITETGPDLVFLDMQMPGMNGLEVIERVGTDAFPHVIFITAYDSYALDAFEVHALDYLLKPLDPARFRRAYERARERIRQGKLAAREGEMEALLDHFRSRPAGRNERDGRLVIQDAGKVFFLDYEEVLWIEASGNYLNIHLSGREHPVLIRQTMKEMEGRLREHSFLRVHRSRMVNLENAREMEQMSDGRYRIHLSGGERVVTSRRYRERMEQALDRWR